MSEQDQQQQKKDKMMKIIVAVLIILAIPGFALLGKFLSGTSSISDTKRIELLDNEISKGPDDAKVTLVEFSDFQCPACRSYYPFIKQATEEFPDDLRVVYRHLPLTVIHPNAEPAAKASEAAALQGKFWEMHDMLFEKQDEWSGKEDPKEMFVSYANEIELDVDQFTNDYESEEITQRIDQHKQIALEEDLDSTPTFFVNGALLEERPRSYEAFKELIQNKINEAK